MSTVALLLMLPIFVLEALGGKYYETSRGVHYYIEISQQYTWFEAYFECNYRNMTLYTYESQAQFDDLYQLLISDKLAETTKPPDVWLGAVGLKGKFVWLNTQKPMTAYHLWSESNPDNSGDKEHCLQIWSRKPILNDLDCLRRIGFVCGVRGMAITEDEPHGFGHSEGGHQTGKYKGLTVNLYQNN